jgi:hypothetical protein
MARFAIDTAVAHARGSSRGEYSQLHAMDLTRDRLMQDIGTSINQSIIDHRAAYLKHREENAMLDKPVTFQIERDPSDPKSRWVNGTPEYSFGIYGLRKLFPSALFIHIVRDCDKVVASMLHFHRLGERNLALDEVDGFRKWERYVRAVLAAEQAYGPETVLRLFHHELVEAPEKSLRHALDFVGETFSSCCLEPLRNTINSSIVDSNYSVPAEVAEHPEVKSARELWVGLTRASPIAAPDSAAAFRLEEQFDHYVSYFRNLDVEYERAQVAVKRLQDEFSERTTWALKLNAELQRKDERILELQDQVRDRSEWGLSLNKTIAEKNARIVELQRTCEERTNWALNLLAELGREPVERRHPTATSSPKKDLQRSPDDRDSGANSRND